MSDRLKRAFDEASKLPEKEQDALAEWILREMESGRRWRDAFASSEDRLAELADEALEEHSAGRTQELEPDSL